MLASRGRNDSQRSRALLPRLPSYRVRIKPSWKARVFGTYHITPYHLLLPLLLMLTTVCFALYLGRLNLQEIDLASECTAAKTNLGLLKNNINVAYPGRLSQLDDIAGALFPVSYKIYVITGLEKEGIGGLLHHDLEKGPRDTLKKLQSDILYLEQRRFGPLQEHLAEKAEEWEYTPSVLPLLGDCRLTSNFGRRRNPFTRKVEFHKALDISAELHTKVIAPAPGRVVTVSNNARGQRYGIYVIIDHNNYYRTVFAHCNKLFVEDGDTVARGQVIAEVGSTGRSTGPHLHYEVRKDNAQQNPLYYILDRDMGTDAMFID